MGIGFSNSPVVDAIISQDSGAYIIDLSEYGITEGFPNKEVESIDGVDIVCYSDIAYTNAYNNIIGINSAITDAVANGYKKIVMPYGQYAVCYARVSSDDSDNNIVINNDNITFDGNGSTFKVIYDSTKRSPYDKKYSAGQWVANDAYIYSFVGNFMVIKDCSHAIVCNCVVIGDKIDRDFTVDAECEIDGSYGICSGGNCFDIDICHNDVSFFMGDAITCSTGTNTIISIGYQMDWQVGTIDSNGNFAVSTTHCSSDYIFVDAATSYFLHGYGYTQGMTGLTNKKYTAHCYTSDAYITSLGEIFVLKSFKTPAGTTRIRLVVEETSIDEDGWEMTLKIGLYGEFVKYYKNKIHNNHRGGMTIGVNDMVITENWFYNNGEAYDYEYSKPGFGSNPSTPSSTRYHINMEDSQGFNITIEKNVFENGYLGIAARGWNYNVTNNTFKNVTVIFYKLRYLSFENNYLDNSNFYAFEYNSDALVRNWDIVGNTIDGTFNIEGTAIVKSIKNNIIRNKVTIDCLVRNFFGNIFEINKDIGFNEYMDINTIPVIKNCSFIKDVTTTVNNSIKIQNAILEECTFERLKVRAVNLKLKTCTITDCGFDIGTGYFYILDNCSAVHSSYALLNNYATFPNNNSFINVTPYTASASITIKDSNILSLSTSYIFDNANSNAQKNRASIWVENSVIEKQDYNTLGLSYCSGQMDFIRTSVICEVTAETFIPATSLTHRFAECTFTNISISAASTDIIYNRTDLVVL